MRYWRPLHDTLDDVGNRPAQHGRQKPVPGVPPRVCDRSYEDNTMTRIMFAFILAMASAALSSVSAQELQLAAGAPERHVVLPGDTLWAISGKFLKEPWRWPEIWRMNREEIRNPHRIFPGDVIVLERDARGDPRLRLQRARLVPQVYSEAIEESIPAIPPNVIRPFLSDPLIVEAHALDSAARIIATQQDRVFIGNGDLAYVVNADPDKVAWQIYRNGKPLNDPETNEVLGYEAYYLGTARQLEPGNPATFQVISMKEEIGRGDRLLPAIRPPLVAYVPHKPDFSVDGRVISVYGGVDAAGRGSIVSINRGAADGIEIGHVLALERNRTAVAREENDRKETVQIPVLRVGLLFIFRTFQRISYGLIVQSEGTVELNDFARTP